MALGKDKTREIRNKISDIFSVENDGLKNNEEHQNEILYGVKDVEMLMPVKGWRLHRFLFQ
jgi:fumarylacetoacetase